MNERGSNHQLLKQNNYNLIKKYIYRNSPISRVEIAHQLGLTTPTITGMVNPMISAGLLRETAAPAEEAKGAGRPRMMLEFVPESHYICGIDTGPYRTNYILTDLLGNTIAVRHTDQPLDDYCLTLERFAREIPEFIAEAGIPKEKVLGVGICLPGMIDGSADKIYDIFHEDWTGHSISTELGERIGLKVEVENNVRARAISADLFDRIVKAEPFAYFFVSYGVACQMIIDGKVLYGQSAAAGEIGHTVVQRNGPVCPTCGNRGCLEALTGERAILQQCRDIMATHSPTLLKELCADPRKLTMDQVLQAQEMGDKETGQVIDDAIEYLGIALANTINLISPRAVVLEGVQDMIPTLKELGIVVGIGHSGATYDQAMSAIAQGATVGTHVGNAMRLFHQHEPAIFGAVMESDVYCETICDGRHLVPGSVRMYAKCKGLDRIVAITDSIMAAGLPDGNYHLGVNDVVVIDGDAKLASNGTRAGSTLTQDVALKNMLKWLPNTLEEILPTLSENPAKEMNLFDRKGSIETGKDADLVLLDEQANIVHVFARGKQVK